MLFKYVSLVIKSLYKIKKYLKGRNGKYYNLLNIDIFKVLYGFGRGLTH